MGDLNRIAQSVNERQSTEVLCIDDLTNSTTSILDGLKSKKGAHFVAPPTVHGRVRIYAECPDLHFPIHFLHVATTVEADLLPVSGNCRAGTVVFGTREAVASFMSLMRECKAQPLYFHGDLIAVRIA